MGRNRTGFSAGAHRNTKRRSNPAAPVTPHHQANPYNPSTNSASRSIVSIAPDSIPEAIA